MSRPVIEVESLSKRYRLGQFNARTLREEVDQFIARLRNKQAGKVGELSGASSEFWALKDVSFSVQPGEVIGIIGRNGAGKSTLLKILSRITEPTTGQARVRGRIASLLEVGTGFHPELSGRENIYLNGTVLGMRFAEVKAKFDEIVAFAEVERFLDTPVKRYSSGMYVRLAFAVAAHLEPEILVLDEVLAVGDAEFQKKCLGKMGDVAQGGRTVLFVSHNMQAVASLCDRAILIESGRIVASGPSAVVIDDYLRDADEAARERVWNDPADAPGNERIRIRRVSLTSEGTDSRRNLTTDIPISIDIEYWILEHCARMAVNVVISKADGSEVLEDWSVAEETWRERDFAPGLYRTICTIPPNLLNRGSFKVSVIFIDTLLVKEIYKSDRFYHFTIVGVEERDVYWHGNFLGPIHTPLRWKTTLVDGKPPPFLQPQIIANQ